MAVIINLKDYTDDWGYEYVIGMGDLSGSAIANQIENASRQEIELHINSVGGSCYAAIQIVNAIKKHGNVKAIIDGIAFSAAAFIACACNSVEATQYTILMIHNSRIFADTWGTFTAEELKQLATETSAQLDAFDKLQVKIMAEKTGMSADEVSTMLSEETWLTGEEAKSLGFVDVLSDTETEPIEQAIYAQAFAHAPMRMVAYAGKNLKTKENSKMSEVINELKAQHEENKGMFASLKELFLGKAQAETQAPEPATPAEPAPAEPAKKTVEELEAENEALKAEIEAEKTKGAENAQALADAKAMMAETKTLLAEVRSNYKPTATAPAFRQPESQGDGEKANFVKPAKK